MAFPTLGTNDMINDNDTTSSSPSPYSDFLDHKRSTPVPPPRPSLREHRMFCNPDASQYTTHRPKSSGNTSPRIGNNTVKKHQATRQNTATSNSQWQRSSACYPWIKIPLLRFLGPSSDSRHLLPIVLYLQPSVYRRGLQVAATRKSFQVELDS